MKTLRILLFSLAGLTILFCSFNYKRAPRAGAVSKLFYAERISTRSPQEVAKLVADEQLQATLQSVREEGDEPTIYNGLFGKDNYRIEFYFSEVTPDGLDPYKLHVKGLNRYRKLVTPIEGYFYLDSSFVVKTYSYNLISHMQYDNDDDPFDTNDSFQTVSQLKGTFKLSEAKESKGAGVFEGKICMDLVKTEHGAYYFPSELVDETRKAGLIMEGKWTSYATGYTKPLIVAYSFFDFVNDVLENFAYGSREIEINTKYRNLGWADYWDNPEWWNTPAGSLATGK